jgi:hypothetical protein
MKAVYICADQHAIFTFRLRQRGGPYIRRSTPLSRRVVAYYSSGVLIPHTATEIRMGVHMDYRKRRLLDTVVEPFLASAKGFLVQGE